MRRGKEDAPGRVDGVRAEAIEQLGRAVAVWVPVSIAVAAGGHHSLARSLAATALLGIVWHVCLNIGAASSRATLATLGPRVPVLRGVLLALFVSTTAGVWVQTLGVGIAANLALAVVIFVVVAGWDTVVARFIAAPTRLMIVGPVAACANVIGVLAHENDGRFHLVGIVDDEAPPDEHESIVLGPTAQIREILERVRPDLVALAPGCDRPATFSELIESASARFRVLELAQFYEYAFGRVPVRDMTQAWFMSVLHLYQRPYSRLANRVADLVGAGTLFLLAAPVFPLLVLLVRCTRGPIFIRQVRVGEHGQLFTMLKFRTMRADAESAGEAVWATENDPRITAAGRLMRRFRLDELPQIWNVVRGEMAIVGPRPERPEFIDELLESVPFWTRRHLVKPGITGWAQVNRGYAADADGSLEKLSYDLWYIRHRSLTVDLVIFTRTLAAVLRGEFAAGPEGRMAADLNPIGVLVHPRRPPQPDAEHVRAEA